jgi:hypothetical protein
LNSLGLLSLSESPNFFRSLIILSEARLTLFLASATVADCCVTPTVTVAWSGTAVAFPSPLLENKSVLLVLTLLIENGIGPASFV